ncbi:MAG: DUF169 domain-containing protein [Candidatus Methanomethylophilaceae archaeon]|nr:hypothetical protein [Gammaproteobacteria bacterium]
MSHLLVDNSVYASKIKSVLKLRYEPVAVKLVPEGEEFPGGYRKPEGQMSHCQAVMRARKGERITMRPEDQSCHVGSSALGIAETPEKVADGTFHYNIGGFDSPEAAAKTISDREIPSVRMAGQVVCPLKDADFQPDVVVLVDIPERLYWIVVFASAEKGGRSEFSTSAFQCTCEDVTSYPLVTQKPNVSLGCYGCRRRTDMAADEMAAGIPYGMVPDFAAHLEKYETGMMAKAKRD